MSTIEPVTIYSARDISLAEDAEWERTYNRRWRVFWCVVWGGMFLMVAV